MSERPSRPPRRSWDVARNQLPSAVIAFPSVEPPALQGESRATSSGITPRRRRRQRSHGASARGARPRGCRPLRPRRQAGRSQRQASTTSGNQSRPQPARTPARRSWSRGSRRARGGRPFTSTWLWPPSSRIGTGLGAPARGVPPFDAREGSWRSRRAEPQRRPCPVRTADPARRVGDLIGGTRTWSTSRAARAVGRTVAQFVRDLARTASPLRCGRNRP